MKELWNKYKNNELVSVLVVVILFTLWAVVLANSKTIGEKSIMLGPDDSEYYSSLQQPDHPDSSCCGEADAYWADETEEGPNGQVIAIITDPRPNERTLPDGRKIFRPAIPTGTKIPVPPSKIRKKPISNPTGHTVIFIGSEYVVFCYEPQALL